MGKYLKIFFSSILSIFVLSLAMKMAESIDVKDDDCLGIAMRPLPRFGKRLDYNHDRLKRACIINRRQIKSEPFWFQNNNDDVNYSLIGNNPIIWRYLFEQLAQQRDKTNMDNILNRETRDLNNLIKSGYQRFRQQKFHVNSMAEQYNNNNNNNNDNNK